MARPSEVIWVLPVPESDTYRVLARVETKIRDDAGTYTTVAIPEGFETDGASIPRPFWITTGTPFRPRFFRAALVHDYLYQIQQCPRALADEVFRRMLVKDGVGRLKAWKMWAALRVAGWIAWRRHARRLAREAAL